MRIWADANGAGQKIILDSGSGSSVTSTTFDDIVIPLHQWTHVAIASDGTNMKGYFNGYYVGGGTKPYWDNGNGGDIIVGISYTSTYPYKGYIDGFRIRSGAISTSTNTSYWGNGFSQPTQIYGAFKSNTIDTVTLTGTAGTGGGYVTFNNATLSTDGNNTETTSALPAGLSLNEAESTDNTATITGDLTADAGDHAINLVARATSDGTNANIDANRKQAYSHTITKASGGAPVLFNARRYVGTGAVRDINGLGFQPDLVWTKTRNIAYTHGLHDSVRGPNNILRADVDNSEDSGNTGTHQSLTSFNSDGFSAGQDADIGCINYADKTYIAWAWKAGGPIGSGSAPSDEGKFKLNGESTERTATTYTVTGSGYAHGKSEGVAGTTYEASYNVDSGFAIIKTTSPGDGTTGNTFPTFIGTPDVIFAKQLDSTNHWFVYHSSAGITSNHRNPLYLNLNERDDTSTTNAWGVESTIGANSGKTWDLGSNNATNNNGTNHRYVYYLWKSVSGVSAFGDFTIASGNTGYALTGLGFKPKLVVIKKIETAGDWNVFDSFRSSADPAPDYLNWNGSGAENTYSGVTCSFDNDGFTLGTYYTAQKYIYMAFA